ncbi:MAG: PAS domain-containing protein [Chloroflexi bacterium]|nr:PAS domain-containing protein [Chloroflexota bacterium]
MADSSRIATGRGNGPATPTVSIGARPGITELRWLQAMLDSIPDGVIYLDRQLIIRAVNRSICGLLGRQPRSLVGRPLGDVITATRDPDGQPYDLALYAARCVDEQSSRDVGPVRIKKRSGATDPQSITMVPYGKPRTGEAGCALFIRDVTPEESAEKLRDTILSLVSHELRTPLLHIKGSVGSLLARDVEWDEETRLYFLGTIDRATDRLSSLVDDLLSISAMEGGHVPLNLENIKPHELVSEGIDEASPFLGEHNVVLNVPEDLPPVRVDISRFLTVLINLLENAAKYSQTGGSIEISATTAGPVVRVSVRDWGPGISDEHRHDIFDPFFRVGPQDLADGVRPPGTGLGLAVARAVVEAHGGRIWVENAEPTGANFIFTMPVVDSKTARNGPVRRIQA